VIRAAHFDNKPRSGRNEVRDEARTERHLPARARAELSAMDG
jgi:hypothetical protein